jgi:hypothetical protein
MSFTDKPILSASMRSFLYFHIKLSFMGNQDSRDSRKKMKILEKFEGINA